MLWASSSCVTSHISFATPSKRINTHYYATPVDFVHRRSFFNDLSFTLEAVLLLTETAFQDSIGCQNLMWMWSLIEPTDMNTRQHTTSYFFSSLMSDSLDEPCQTRTFSPSVWVAISFLHCMTATVGLKPRVGQRLNQHSKEIIRTQPQDWVYADLTRREKWFE